MKDIKKQIEELLMRKVKNCKNSIAIFDTKDYVLLDDVIDDVSKILSQYVSDTTFVDAYRAIIDCYRWRKVSEELPNNKQIVLAKDACECCHTAHYYSNINKFYSVTVYELKNRECLPIPSVIEWKPID